MFPIAGGVARYPHLLWGSFPVIRWGSSSGFPQPEYQPFFTAVPTAGITSSYLGFRQGIELACESQNPQRDIPLAIIGWVDTYALLQAAKSSSRARGKRLRAEPVKLIV